MGEWVESLVEDGVGDFDRSLVGVGASGER
jgi:hypothetical protein